MRHDARGFAGFMTHKHLPAGPQRSRLYPHAMSDENFSPEFGSAYRVLLDHCESARIKFRAEPDLKAVFFSVRGEAAIYDVSLLVTHDEQVFQIYMTIPVAANDKKLRPLVAEVATRANHNLVLGCFDFDLDDGNLRYHIGHASFDGRLEDGTVGRLIGTALCTADRYFPAFMRVMFGGHTPADAVYLAELDYQEEDAKDAPAAELPAAPPPSPAPKATKPQSKKKIRRPRRDARLKSTREFPGLFDKGAEGEESGRQTPESRGEA